MRIAIGCDEAAYDLKNIIIKHLETKGIEVKDFGSSKMNRYFTLMLPIA